MLGNLSQMNWLCGRAWKRILSSYWLTQEKLFRRKATIPMTATMSRIMVVLEYMDFSCINCSPGFTISCVGLDGIVFSIQGFCVCCLLSEPIRPLATKGDASTIKTTISIISLLFIIVPKFLPMSWTEANDTTFSDYYILQIICHMAN